MKALLLLLTSMCVLSGARGAGVDSCQTEFWRLIGEGDSLRGIDSFNAALNKYNSAQTYCRQMADTAQARIATLFEKIEGMRKIAETQADTLVLQKRELQTTFEKLESKSRLAFALQKAIYFYDNRYGLVQEQGRGAKRSFFVDTAGRKADFLGMWWAAGPFINGYARVQNPVPKTDALADSLLDFRGNRYSLAYAVDRMDSKTTALDLTRSRDTKLPSKLFTYSKLQVLILNSVLGLEIPTQISALQNLTHLDVSDCRLKNELPPALFSLKNLRTLYLSGNLGLKKLPPSIAGLNSLEGLYLDRTSITELPAEIGELTNLRELDIRQTNIKTLPDSISKLRKLERIFMRPGQLPPAERAKISVPYELVTRPN